MRNLTCSDQQILLMVKKLVTKDWIHVTLGLFSEGDREGWEAVEIAHTSLGDYCLEVQMLKIGVTVKRISSLKIISLKPQLRLRR